MLIRLFGRNFRSLKDDFELSMVAADFTRQEDRERGVIVVPIKGLEEPLSLLRVAAIYGPNASGKSAILTAAKALSWLVKYSSQRTNPDDLIPRYEPFLLNKESRSESVQLGCDVVFEEAVLRYQVEFTEQQILKERLLLLDGNNETALIDRNDRGKINGELVSRSKVNKLYVTDMQSNVTILSKLAQHGPSRGKDSLRPYHKAIVSGLNFVDYSDATRPRIFLGRGNKDERFADDAAYRQWIMKHLIQSADVGIEDVAVKRENMPVPPELRKLIEKDGEAFSHDRVVVSFVHKGQDPQALNFEVESAGTRKLFNIAGDWWNLANEEGALFADELSASLHPRLLGQLIRAVNAPSCEEIKSQLIFATHDTGLMESANGKPPALRRDQVYFTKKGPNGATELYSLTEFKEDARPVHNIRKRYLSGYYDALPDVEKISL